MICGIAVAVAVIIVVIILIQNNREIVFSDLHTKYDSISIDFKYSDDCSDDRTYKVDFKNTIRLQSKAMPLKKNIIQKDIS